MTMSKDKAGYKPSKKILLVDDEQGILKAYKSIITDSFPDYAVDTAANGFDAIEAFSHEKHDLVIMDLHMPVMDGVKAQYEIQTLCENRDRPTPAFIFCTGYMPPHEVRDIVRSNPACSLLLKPIGSDLLVGEIKKRLVQDEAGVPAS